MEKRYVDTSKNQELPPEPKREKLDKLADPPQKQDETINEVASLATSEADKVFPPLTEAERQTSNVRRRESQAPKRV
jgi:hypothetical protein